MSDGKHQKESLYARRLEKELGISECDIAARMRWSLPVLSQNRKCGVSLDLPMTYCQPTRVCASVCYACQGTQAWRNSVVKSLAIDRMIEVEPERIARKMVDEAEGRQIRIAGSGEILPEHKVLLNYVEQHGGSYWGFTRRVDTHRVLRHLMFSFDVTTPDNVMEYVRESVPADRRAYLRRPSDPEPMLEVAVTFPVHGPVTSWVAEVPVHETDCPVDRGEIAGCWSCRRCY